MPPKKQLPAPIDRPLSRAYLRQFTGWSTAYPPGVSEPTSLRIMENVRVNRDGSVGVRPGLKHLSYNGDSSDPFGLGFELVGTHETFFLDDGSKALLFAARTLVSPPVGPPEPRVAFFVAFYDPTDTAMPYRVRSLDDAGFALPTDFIDITFSPDTTYVSYVQIDNKVLALSNNGEPALLFFVGAAKRAKKLVALPGPSAGTSFPWPVGYDPHDPTTGAQGAPPTLNLPDHAWLAAGFTGTPVYVTPTANTLISSSDAANVYSMAAFFTFANELGESAASEVVTVKMQRPWSGWQWLAPNASDEPDPATPTTDPTQCADQLVLRVSTDQFDANLAAGATKLNVYAATWRPDQDPQPIEAVLVGSRDLTDVGPAGSPADSHGFPLDGIDAGWVQITPAVPSTGVTVPIPNAANRRNWTVPPTAGQGLVAADRLVLVYDPVNQGQIRWTANQQGDYLDFSASRGGGYKTLTSGNLMVPACVKLWQNPQSADTLTILCMGSDGHSTGYYMAPAQVASQSEATNVMGFEETTATPGTTSPFGCEVANNALYHPLDTQLMKSTATNYNINHKSMTDLVRNQWARLANKDQIVSCEHDSRLYYIVHNPDGAELEAGCMGNEIWVLDIAAKAPTWSRWLIQASALRTLEVLGQVYLSVVRPDGIFYLDEEYHVDDFVNTVPGHEGVGQHTIAWRLETNTQGANRAHDAWAHLQQANIQVGNFRGTMKYGVRGRNIHGKTVVAEKVIRSVDTGDDLPFDLEDFLLIRHDLRDWFFYAEAVFEAGLYLPSSGQVNLVQYRYTPVTVNTGYEFGSVETFEYGRAANDEADRTTVNGVPMPFIDTGRP